MQEKKFKVQLKKEFENFKKNTEYWVYMVKEVEGSDQLSFLMFDEITSKWGYYDASLFIPVQERTADELLADFQKSMGLSKK